MMMKAHQRLIREEVATQEAAQNLFGAYWEDLNLEISKSIIRQIDYQTAKSIILQYEWLGNMGTTEFSFGLYFDNCLAGVVCFGRTAGTNVYSSVCGQNHANKVITLCRGACVHWAHEHSASRLIAASCRMMTEREYNIFIAYADTEAGEIGTVYQACNWLYCGMTSPTEKFRTPDGKVKDARLVSAYTRDRRGGSLKYKRTRAEQKKIMVDQGYKFFTPTIGKHRYVGIYGNRRIKRQLAKALKWEVLPYPKR